MIAAIAWRQRSSREPIPKELRDRDFRQVRIMVVDTCVVIGLEHGNLDIEYHVLHRNNVQDAHRVAVETTQSWESFYGCTLVDGPFYYETDVDHSRLEKALGTTTGPVVDAQHKAFFGGLFLMCLSQGDPLDLYTAA